MSPFFFCSWNMKIVEIMENCENYESALADRLTQTNVDFARPRLRKAQKNPEPEKAPD